MINIDTIQNHLFSGIRVLAFFVFLYVQDNYENLLLQGIAGGIFLGAFSLGGKQYVEMRASIIMFAVGSLLFTIFITTIYENPFDFKELIFLEIPRGESGRITLKIAYALIIGAIIGFVVPKNKNAI